MTDHKRLEGETIKQVTVETSPYGTVNKITLVMASGLTAWFYLKGN